MRTLLVLLVGLSAFACGGFDCPAKCEKIKTELARVLQSQGQTPDEATLCSRQSIEEAKDCDECKAALLQEYGVAPVDGADFCH